MENKKQFKPFDKVLVRDHENVWQPDLYGFWDKCRDNHTTMTDSYISDSDILPYEGNEELVGTIDEPEEEVGLEEGELIFTSYDTECEITNWVFERFKEVKHEGFKTNMGITKYSIRFSDFNHYDMEETKKHILCVKNGKIVRYKG